MAAPELKEAYTLIKQKDHEGARDLLIPYIDEHPGDPNAWWLMANAVEERELRQESLERVLEINPNHAPAKKALHQLQHGGAPTPPQREPNGAADVAFKSKGKPGTSLYNYPLNLRFKIIALAPQIYVTDANGNSVLYVRQKILNLREDVRIFRDDSKTDEVFRINADRILDIGARYRFTDSKTEQPLGAIKQRGLKTIWKAHYDIETPSGNATHDLTEDNPWVKVGDALLGEIPFLGLVSGYLLHPAYTVKDSTGLPIMHLVKEPAFFESKYRIDLMTPEINPDEEKRLLLSVMMMVQLTRMRG